MLGPPSSDLDRDTLPQNPHFRSSERQSKRFIAFVVLTLLTSSWTQQGKKRLDAWLEVETKLTTLLQCMGGVAQEPMGSTAKLLLM